MNTSRRRSKTDILATVLPTIMRDKGWERKVDQHRIFLEWEDVVDEETAAHSRPLRVVKDVLWLEVVNSSWVQQLQYQKFYLLETLNEYLTIARYSDIRFSVEEKQKELVEKEEKAIRFIPPSPERVEQFTQQISSIEDENIKESLMRLWYLAQACRKEE